MTATASSSSREHRNSHAGLRDNDFLANAASALQRRFHFTKSSGNRNNVPKLIIRDSSTASETTINTSTDSQTTLITLVNTTDSEQHDDSLDLMDVHPEFSPPPVTSSSSFHPHQHHYNHQQQQQQQQPTTGHSNGVSAITAIVTAATATATASAVNSTSPPPLQQQKQRRQSSSPPTPQSGTTNSQTMNAQLPARPIECAAQMNGLSSSANVSPTALHNGHANGPTTAVPMISMTNLCVGGTNSPGAPPPTPMIGPHQESRFTFPGLEISRPKPALPDLRAADFFSQPVRGSVDAGQPDPQQISSMLALVAAKEKQRASPPSSLAKPLEPQTVIVGVQPAQCNGNAGSNAGSPVDTKQASSGSRSPTLANAKPNINVTTNPLDISLCANGTVNGNGSSGGTTGTGFGVGGAGRGRGRPTESHPLVSTIHSWVRLFFPFCAIGGNAAGGKRTAQATIVVQQPSLSLDAPAATILLRPADPDAKRREENMRQLLDVANSLTLQEYHDFEMRYGSPHHNRSQSVRTPGSRASGRPNYLCLPQQRSRVASMPNTGVEEDFYRLRHFSITTKGVVNRGDSLKSRRSRSNNSVASSNSSTEHLTASYPGSARNSAAGSLASSRESSASQGPAPYRVLMLGASAVGKSSLVSQFMTSEYLHAYDTSVDDESGEKTVNILLNGEESELTFIDHPSSEMAPENCIATYEPHGYCVVYSTADRSSARVAEEVLQSLWRSDHMSARAVILVGNKVDLVRCRFVTTEEGKQMAINYDCKFIETAVSINHNVDELLVGLLSQIRLKLENPERCRDIIRRRSRRNRSRSPIGSCSENNSPKKYRGSRTSASLKVRSLLGKVWARDSKSKSCENLHVL
ncbi:uncharacterized protein LOC106639394 [Copidosoma floridanum]|uniref:uncharacterized protein LOC106639394 n=1 Tax=Copidosoma floridanum TaxID=29053 RepID=UPI000C6FBB95|nr:uncharacterized protein LOC106639394 [Copidosoma floridanum]